MIYASPKAVVKRLAVDPEINPPAAVPTPGINLMILETIVLPNTVAPAVPIVDETNPVITLLLMSIPKIVVIVAIIAT